MIGKKLLRLLFLFSTFSIVGPLHSLAQNKEVKYIYLFDCTTSMKGYGGAPDIWQKAKQCLKGDIDKKPDQCDILFIPFQDGRALSTAAFQRRQFDWDEIEGQIDGVVDTPTNTDIISAWNRAMKAVNPHGQNVVYLLTDGNDNVHGANAVADLIRQWCPTAPDNVQVVYFMLTKASENQAIEQAAEECRDHIRVVKGIQDNIVTMNGTVWRFDTGRDTVRADRYFTFRHSFAAHVSHTSPYYEVKIVGDRVNDGLAHLIAVKKVSDAQLQQLPERLDFEVTIHSDNPDEVNIINPTFPAEVINTPVNTLQLLNNNDDLDLGDADYHPAFLFWKESDPAQAECDLKADFNRHARKVGSAVQFRVTSDKGNDDFDVLYNGQVCPDRTFIVRTSDSRQLLTLRFHKDADTDKRHFLLTPIAANDLAHINNKTPQEYRMTLAADYDINMHPMKVLCLWMAVILLALSILWFLALKWMFFPPFKGVRQLKVTEPVFAVKKLKGARRLVMSSTQPRKKQSALGRLFTGPIVYFVNPSFLQSTVTAEPDGKSVRLRTANTVLCMPLNKLSKGMETELEETDTNRKMKLQVL